MLSLTLKRTLTRILVSAFVFLPNAMAKTVQDINGNAIELADNVAHVADLWHANNQIVLLLGGADKLVATTGNIQKSKWFNAVYPNIKNVAALSDGTDIQLEELLKKAPQAVLVSSPAMLESVQKAGLKGVLVSFQDFDGLKKTVQITADVLGDNAPNIAKTYLKELDENIRFVAERTKTLSENEKPTVLHITSASNLLMVDGGASMIGEWIKLAGGKSVLPEVKNKAEVSIEEIIAANPDVIIVGSNDAAKGVEKIQSSPEWQSINAVKNHRVFVNPLGTFPWDRYSAEEALQILWAAQLFHPERFADVNMVEKTQQFYQKYYHYTLSEENAQQILKGLNPIGK